MHAGTRRPHTQASNCTPRRPRSPRTSRRRARPFQSGQHRAGDKPSQKLECKRPATSRPASPRRRKTHRRQEILLRHSLSPRTNRKHSCLCAHGPDVGARDVRAQAGEQVPADVALAVDGAAVDFEDLRAPLEVGEADLNLPIEAARAQQRRVERVLPSHRGGRARSVSRRRGRERSARASGAGGPRPGDIPAGWWPSAP